MWSLNLYYFMQAMDVLNQRFIDALCECYGYKRQPAIYGSIIFAQDDFVKVRDGRCADV